MYRLISLACVSFGLVLFYWSWNFVEMQEAVEDIIAFFCLGVAGSVLTIMGLFGLWEHRK